MNNNFKALVFLYIKFDAKVRNKVKLKNMFKLKVFNVRYILFRVNNQNSGSDF